MLRQRLDYLSFARRLMWVIVNSSVTALLQDEVLSFVRDYQKSGNLIQINGDKFDISTKRVQSAFISLLNDDFLYSKLTKRDNESSARGR